MDGIYDSITFTRKRTFFCSCTMQIPVDSYFCHFQNDSVQMPGLHFVLCNSCLTAECQHISKLVFFVLCFPHHEMSDDSLHIFAPVIAAQR